MPRMPSKDVHKAAILFLCAASGFIAPSPASAAQTIQWEVANRFPLFREEKHFRAIADIYAALPLADRQDKPVLALETALENRANARTLGAAFGDPATIWRYGWASALARSTCFSETNRGHWGCKLANGEDYIGARKADILVSLDSATAGAPCQWLVNGTVIATSACTDRLVRLPGLPIGQAFALSVKSGDTVLADLPAETIRPVTIAGMGDSFASGEGNPDRAAPMGTDVSDFGGSSHRPGSSKLRLYPLRVNHAPGVFGTPALWLNQQCHRSLYSHQLKAALALALEAPHVSVTYLGYACTGAEVTEGILGYWKGRDDVSSSYRDDSPQMMRALRDLCADRQGYNRFSTPSGSFAWDKDIRKCAAFRSRPLDALLISIGGNDIGFSSVIANEVIDNKRARFSLYRKLLYGLWLKSAGPLEFADAIANEDKVLPDRLKALSQASQSLLNLKPQQIIQTGYPQMLKTTTGTCPIGLAGMDLHEIFSISKASTGPNSENFVNGLNAKISSLVPWQVVSGFAAGFSGHALCEPGMDDGSRDPDGLAFPIGSTTGQSWAPFSPPNWQPYRVRKRWFVTPNDAFLTANYMRTKSGSGGDINTLGIAQPLIAATMSGSFHPNALGQAAMGDGVLKTLRFKLQLPAPAAIP